MKSMLSIGITVFNFTSEASNSMYQLLSPYKLITETWRSLINKQWLYAGHIIQSYIGCIMLVTRQNWYSHFSFGHDAVCKYYHTSYSAAMAAPRLTVGGKEKWSMKIIRVNRGLAACPFGSATVQSRLQNVNVTAHI